MARRRARTKSASHAAEKARASAKKNHYWGKEESSQFYKHAQSKVSVYNTLIFNKEEEGGPEEEEHFVP